MRAKTEPNSKPVDNTNFYFILKCMAALTAAALVTAGFIAFIAMKTSAVVMAGIAAKTMFAAAVATSPFIPVVGVLAFIGLVAAACILPFIFSGSSSSYTTVRTTPAYNTGWGWGSGWGSSTLFVPSNPVYDSHRHGHYNPVYNGGPIHVGGHHDGHHHDHFETRHTNVHTH